MLRSLITTLVAILVVSGCSQSSKEGNASADLGPKDSGQKTTAASARSGPKAQTACEVLTAGEIAGVLKIPEAKKDTHSSGKNELTKVDFCYWYVTGRINPDRDERLEVILRRAESTDEGALLMLFSAAKGDATEHDFERDRKAQPLSAVGDEAIYSAYPDGGSVALRVGTSAVTISGLVSKDALIAMAKLAARKL